MRRGTGTVSEGQYECGREPHLRLNRESSSLRPLLSLTPRPQSAASTHGALDASETSLRPHVQVVEPRPVLTADLPVKLKGLTAASTPPAAVKRELSARRAERRAEHDPRAAPLHNFKPVAARPALSRASVEVGGRRSGPGLSLRDPFAARQSRALDSCRSRRRRLCPSPQTVS